MPEPERDLDLVARHAALVADGRIDVLAMPVPHP